MFKSTALGSFILSIFDDFFLGSSALSLFNFTFPDISVLFFSGSSEYISAFSLTSPTGFLPYKIPLTFIGKVYSSPSHVNSAPRLSSASSSSRIGLFLIWSDESSTYSPSPIAVKAVRNLAAVPALPTYIPAVLFGIFPPCPSIMTVHLFSSASTLNPILSSAFKK